MRFFSISIARLTGVDTDNLSKCFSNCKSGHPHRRLQGTNFPVWDKIYFGVDAAPRGNKRLLDQATRPPSLVFQRFVNVAEVWNVFVTKVRTTIYNYSADTVKF